MSIKSRVRQLGQGMTEYIIIVALIAISAIVVYNLFGNTVRDQVGNMAAELGGGEGTNDARTRGETARAEGDANYRLDNFQQNENR